MRGLHGARALARRRPLRRLLGEGVPYRFAATPALLQCRACRHKVSLTSGTAMHGTKQPLHVWLWAAYLVTTQTAGMSALQFQRQLHLSRYETAFQLLHKLRAGMVRPEKDQIGDPYVVEVDEAFVSGRTKGKGRGVTDAPLVIAAVEIRSRVSEKKGRRSALQTHPRGIAARVLPRRPRAAYQPTG